MIEQSNPPICTRGYESTDRRPPQDGSNRPMNMQAHCAEPAAESNPRGAQHAPQRPVASYDPATGELTWGARVPDGLSQPRYRRHPAPSERSRGSGCSSSP